MKILCFSSLSLIFKRHGGNETGILGFCSSHKPCSGVGLNEAMKLTLRLLKLKPILPRPSVLYTLRGICHFAGGL